VSRFLVHDSPLSGLKIIDRKPIDDERGSFVRLFCGNDLAKAGWQVPVAQVNQSVTAKAATVRGMHFQSLPHTEMKLVSCITGAVLDVAVDLRSGSSTFLAYHSETLSAANNRAMLIPPGFAHGFQALTDDTTLIYLHSAAYVQRAEGGLNAFDPRLAIKWPLSVSQISERDRTFMFISADYEGLTL
jgi:dTDP-4-dehydrorhamnose 3,5-epimerase